MIKDIISAVSSVAGEFIEDKDKTKELEHKLKQSLINLDALQAQANIESAKHPSLFVSGARPAILWICGLGLFWQFFLSPILNWILVVSGSEIPPLNMPVEGLLSLTISLLGLGGMRSFEKSKGVARNNLKD
mgnify:CR=1 FL=1